MYKYKYSMLSGNLGIEVLVGSHVTSCINKKLHLINLLLHEGLYLENIQPTVSLQ